MRAVVIHEFGPIENHKVEEWPDPTIGPDEVLIETRAIGINYPDALMLRGLYQKRAPVPFVPGRDMAGVVREVGSEVTRCKPGDRVVAQVFTGAFGELTAAPQKRCFPLPDDMPFEAAAAMITPFNTAWIAVDVRGQVTEGETVMVTGAAGGVGLAAIQFLKARGARVLAAVSTPEKGKLAMDNGADALVDTNASDLRELKDHLKAQVAEITGAKEGRGCDVVIEAVGGDLFEASMRVLNFGGRLVIVGFAGGTIPAPKANYLLYNNISIIGAPLDIRFEEAYDQIEAAVAETGRLYVAGKAKPNITATMPLDDFHEAFDAMIGRQMMGKIVLTVGT
ncbi:MAG: NADPH:quinone oxidoreductase family protein [Alphaproteobacteria bacterium]